MKEDKYQPFSYLDDCIEAIPEYIRNMTIEELDKAIEEKERKIKEEREKTCQQEKTHSTSFEVTFK